MKKANSQFLNCKSFQACSKSRKEELKQGFVLVVWTKTEVHFNHSDFWPAYGTHPAKLCGYIPNGNWSLYI